MRRPIEIAAGLGLAWLASQAAARAASAPPGLAPPAPSLAPSAQPAPSAEPARSPVEPAPPAAEPVLRARPLIDTSTTAQPIGARYDDDAAMATHADPVADYTLHASLDPVRHTVNAQGKIHWRNASRVPQSELWLHLYLNAFKTDRTYFMRFNAGDFRGAGHLDAHGSITVKRFALAGGDDLWPSADKTSPGDPEDETDIRVPLPHPVAPGEAIDIDVEFESHLPALLFRTGYFGGYNMVAQWFPKLARLETDGRWAHFPFHRLSEFYADFGTYDVTIDTPEVMVVGATGALQSETRAGGRVQRRYVQADVHDFAFTAWDQYRELNVRTDEGVAVRVLYPPSYDRVAAAEVEAVRFGLRHFGEAYGRYPYKTLTVVHPPAGAEESGGMEYPTLITTGGYWFNEAMGARLVDIVTLHELGHQWFYGLVATNENASPFLDEGINSYAESESMEAWRPHASAFAGLGLMVGLPAVQRYASAGAQGNAPVAQPASAFANGADYGALVYSRTATIMTTLSRVYGADTIRRAVGRYARRYRFEHPRPADLLQAVREVAGEDAAEQLRVAIFERGGVDYTVVDLFSEPDVPARGIGPEAPKASPGGYRGSALVRRIGTLRFPVDIDLIGVDGTVQRVRWDAAESSARLSYHGPSRLASAVIDPEHRVLLDDNLSNNARRLKPQSLSGAVVDQLSFAASAALSGLLP